ncbi:hypothetical protein [Hymenobacter chitinivorans]|uniref:Trimeric autotransporter adhesin n=1 Tax=Hymenobacter chitinivorans DSM 11115 TaxID=1121954 RepID=A0A2M9ASY1_9BACT|nr:hypothetical protein [Hymenobacter chitinivorans]PJJ48743.1 hypothetical protein CLV45_4453 [Hymenobacter chitinivorans DSM 11115]
MPFSRFSFPLTSYRPGLAAAVVLVLLGRGPARAQSVGIGTTTPNSKAVLDIVAPNNNQGLLIPRLDSVQRVGIANPPDGLMVFQKNGRQGLWYALGGQWLFVPDRLRGGDNLGNHTATKNINLGTYKIVGNGGTVGVGVSSKGGLDLGANAGNVLVGIQAGASLAAGANSNTFVGYQSGQNVTTGYSNTLGGFQSGSNVTTGLNNTFLGYQSGFAVTTGSGNTAVGAFAGPTNFNLENTTAIGFRAQVSRSNSVVLGGTGPFAVNVGIGTTNPQRTLDVSGSIRQTTYNTGSTRLSGNASASIDWNHNLGYQPTLMLALDQTNGGGAEYVGVSYEHVNNNTVRFWLHNTSNFNSATFVLRWIRVD